jgi:hypothetical protein
MGLGATRSAVIYEVQTAQELQMYGSWIAVLWDQLDTHTHDSALLPCFCRQAVAKWDVEQSRT